MRHCKHRRIKAKGLENSLIRALMRHGRVITTQGRAKLMRSPAEKVITKIKKCLKENNLTIRRELLSHYGNQLFVQFKDLYPYCENRNGGYTRITKLDSRKGDNADMAVISITGAFND